MTIEELEKFIKKYKIPKNTKIILSNDAEGNSYNEVDEADIVTFNFDYNEIDKNSKECALILWPIN